MALNLGTIFTEIRMNTRPLGQARNEVASIIGGINQSLSQIKDIAIGNTLSAGINAAIGEIGNLPKSMLKAAADTEQAILGIQTTFEQAGKRSAQTWSESMKELADATETETKRAQVAGEKLGGLFEDRAKQLSDAIRELADAGSERERGVGKVQQTAGDQESDRLRSAARNLEDFTKAQSDAMTALNHQTREADEQFSDSIGARDKEWRRSMRDLETQHELTQEHIRQQEQDTVSDFATQQQQRATEFTTQMHALSDAHGRAVDDINKNWDREVDHFAQANDERDAAFGRANTDLLRDFQKTADAIARSMDETVQASADKTAAIARQLAQTMEGLRLSEEQQNFEFANRMEDANARVAKATTPAERQAAQKDVQRLQAQKAFADRQNALQLKNAQTAARIEQEANEKSTAQALKHLRQQEQDAVASYARQSAEIQRAYAQDVLHAAQANEERVADFNEAMGRENDAYAAHVTELDHKYQQDQANANAAQDRKLRDLQRASAEEQAANDRARNAAQERYDDETERATTAYAKQLRAAQEMYAKTKEAADAAFARQNEDADTRHEREVRGIDEALSEIERRYTESAERIQRAGEESARAYGRALRDITRDAEEANQALTAATDKKMGEINSRAGEVSKMFSDTWVDSVNRINEAFGTKFKFTATDDAIAKTDQIKKWARDMAHDLPLTFRETLDTSNRLMQYGLDPVNGGLLRIVAAMSQLPGVTGGVRQVGDAFGALATGQMGEAVQRFREFGVDLRSIPGLSFDAGGALKTDIPSAMAAILKAMGPDAERVLQTFNGSFNQLWSNFLDILEDVQARTGDKLFGNTKGALKDFITYLDSPEGVQLLNSLSTNIGDALGAISATIIDWVKALGNPEVIKNISKFINDVGVLKDRVTAFLGSEELQNAVRKFTGWVGDVVTAITTGLNSPETQRNLTAFTTAIQNMSKEVLKVVANPDVQEAVRGLSREIGALLKSASTLGADLINALRPKDKEDARPFESLETAMQNLANNDIQAVRKAFQDFGGDLGKLEGLTWDARGNLATPLDEAADIIRPALQDKMSKPADDFKIALDNISGAIRDVRKAIDDFNNSGFIQQLTDIGTAADATAGFLNSVMRASQALGTMLRPSEAAIDQALPNPAIEQVKRDMDEAETQERRVQSSNLANSLETFWTDVTTAMVTPVNEQVDPALVGWVEHIGHLLFDGLGAAADKGVEAFRVGMTNPEDGIPAVLEDVHGHSIIDDWMTELHDWMPKTMGNVGEDAVAAFRKPFDDLPNQLEGARGGIETWVSNFKDVLVRGVTDAVNEVMRIFSGLPAFFSDVLHQIHGSGMITPWLASLQNVLTSGLAAVVQSADAAFSALPDVIGDSLTEAAGEVSRFAENAKQGLGSVSRSIGGFNQEEFNRDQDRRHLAQVAKVREETRQRELQAAKDLAKVHAGDAAYLAKQDRDREAEKARARQRELARGRTVEQQLTPQQHTAVEAQRRAELEDTIRQLQDRRARQDPRLNALSDAEGPSTWGRDGTPAERAVWGAASQAIREEHDRFLASLDEDARARTLGWENDARAISGIRMRLLDNMPQIAGGQEEFQRSLEAIEQQTQQIRAAQLALIPSGQAQPVETGRFLWGELPQTLQEEHAMYLNSLEDWDRAQQRGRDNEERVLMGIENRLRESLPANMADPWQWNSMQQQIRDQTLAIRQAQIALINSGQTTPVDGGRFVQDQATGELIVNTGPIYNYDQGVAFVDRFTDHLLDRLEVSPR